jgi:hypothetical protein
VGCLISLLRVQCYEYRARLLYYMVVRSADTENVLSHPTIMFVCNQPVTCTFARVFCTQDGGNWCDAINLGHAWLTHGAFLHPAGV